MALPKCGNPGMENNAPANYRNVTNYRNITNYRNVMPKPINALENPFGGKMIKQGLLGGSLNGYTQSPSIFNPETDKYRQRRNFINITQPNAAF